MNRQTFTPHAYGCNGCGWLVPMEYVRGGTVLGDYVTNESLRAFHAVATTRLSMAGNLASFCNKCGVMVSRVVAS